MSSRMDLNQLSDVILQSTSRGKQLELLMLNACETAKGDPHRQWGLPVRVLKSRREASWRRFGR